MNLCVHFPRSGVYKRLCARVMYDTKRFPDTFTQAGPCQESKLLCELSHSGEPPTAMACTPNLAYARMPDFEHACLPKKWSCHQAFELDLVLYV